MLVVTRGVGESVQAGECVIRLCEIRTSDRGGKTVRLGIDAPRGVKILRSELIERDTDGESN